MQRDLRTPSDTQHGYTAWGRTHKGGSSKDEHIIQDISPPGIRHQAIDHQAVKFTRHQALEPPVTRYLEPVSRHQVISDSPASVAQLDAPSDWRPGGRGFNPRRGRQHSFVEIDHEIFSTVILSLPLIQEGQLSVSGERMCTILVNRLED